MKGYGFYKYGGIDAMQEIEIPDPEAGEGEILIKVKYASINRLDLLVRSGYHGLKLEMPHFPGTDVAGEVVGIGKGVDRISEGDLVVANTIFGCGRCSSCSSGHESLCPDWKVIGLHTNGSYADIVKVPASVALLPPSGYSIEELSAMPLSLSVSWRAISLLSEKRGKTVVVRSASGNIGIFSIMLAKAMEMNVIALTRNSEKAALLRCIGADKVILTAEGEDAVIKEVKEAGGADLIIEISGSTLGYSAKMINDGGIIALFGTIGGIESTVSIPSLYLKNATIAGMHNSDKPDLSKALVFAKENGIKPKIAKVFQISAVREAQAAFESSKYFGKILLRH